MISPAIIVIAYNRPHRLHRLLTSLNNSKYDFADVPLIISIDKSDVREIYEVA
jgi:glycosyltransferase involved in cell wall biosynthesis